MLKKILISTLTIMNKILPKDRRITFHSFPDFSDNSRTVFDYIINKGMNKKYKIIWLVDDVDRFKHINIDNVSFVKRKSFCGLLSYLRSEIIFHTTGLFGNIASPKNQKNISLWHGMPLKTIGLLDKKSIDIYSDFNFSYTIATSKLYKDIMSRAFGCSAEKVIVTGQPRNDLLFSKRKVLDKVVNKHDGKVVLWMPTYRKSSSGHIREEGIESETGIPILTKENIISLDLFLEKINFKMIIKIHPMQKIDDLIKEKLKNITIIENDYLDKKDILLYELLGEVDILLTDYSSVYLDFLITNRPIGFVFDDIDTYGKTRGFVFDDPLEMMPGKHIYSFKDLKLFLMDMYNDNDEYLENRIKVNSIVNEFNDNKNSERLLEYIGLN